MIFDWCLSDAHDKCVREFNRFYIDPKTNKAVVLDEVVRCDCRKRGCKCYTKPADRKKPVKRRRK